MQCRYQPCGIHHRGYAKHKSCCNEVVKAVNGADGFAVGIIDDDKRRATMDAGFREYVPAGLPNDNTLHVKLFIHDYPDDMSSDRFVSFFL